MVRALFDTNILLDYLKGIEAAELEFSRYHDIAISVVSRIEVLVGVTHEIEPDVRSFLDHLPTVQLGTAVAERTVALRRLHRVKLADAIIWASAQMEGRLLVTRDRKDFPSDDPGIRMPYRV
ncbi:MAG: type II toxin-antitoxin system VapC family toxin [Alphaproteobacteria bacterium]|nr:type II toxin-antitoxin system VapC family toxin [Alphaproteobacteria bacterium]